MTPYVHNSDKYAHIPHLNTHTQRHKFRRTSVPVRLASQITQVCRSFSMAIFDGDGTHTHTLTHTHTHTHIHTHIHTHTHTHRQMTVW